ncbi:hypothetical protein DSM101010T_34640 [Desulfovibrio subterraneus]|uniref:Uncharacterized protein n=2 Tax=Desulfovibrio subterraneus TaxID=2718620 RepID=A0A7J0BN66_9BACT|nr:hypothetical protein DSM101010T_34640 [Desulfovibrio subterraneus]
MALRHMHGNEDATRSALEMLGQTKGGDSASGISKTNIKDHYGYNNDMIYTRNNNVKTVFNDFKGMKVLPSHL